MENSNFGVEIILPGDLQKQLDEITDKMAAFLIKAFKVFYPDGDFPENYMEEVLSILVPKVQEGMERAVDKLIEEMG